MIYIVLSAIAIIIAIFYFRKPSGIEETINEEAIEISGVEETIEILCIAYCKSVKNGKNAKEALNDMVSVAIKMVPMLRGMSSENYLSGGIDEKEYKNMPTNIKDASSFVKREINILISSYTHRNIYNCGIETIDDMFNKQKTKTTLLNEMIEDKYNQYCL